MSITRRLFLHHAAAAGAAAIVSTSALPAELEHPWVKARRLACELSETLTECDGGACYAEIFSAGGEHMPFTFGSIDALPSMMQPMEREEHHLIKLTAAMEEHSGARWRSAFDRDNGFVMALQRYD